MDDAIPSRGTIVVTGLSSDSHTWALVYLNLLIEELGYDVINLGPCVPDELLATECMRIKPMMVVVSSVNGHGRADGLQAIRRLRACSQLRSTPVVIGGKLSVSPEAAEEITAELIAAGFDAVFADGSVDAFRAFVALTGSRHVGIEGTK
ncbi:cobalamin B12-binding domain-containing protein [Nocardia sp. NPDC088792]|uniref:cobalamin B12-binding domain-containing protein n=1 Tax=Nocardia sp. NPDC088792 TaxID=3364332 RepID=UPI003801489E